MIRKKLIQLFIIVLFLNCSCSNRKESNTIEFDDSEGVAKSWSNCFLNHRVIDFKFQKNDQNLISISSMQVNSANEIMIFDCKGKKFIRFDENGFEKSSISNFGDGPGELKFPTNTFCDNNDNLYVFDIFKKRLFKFTYPSYFYEKEIKINQSCTSLTCINNNKFIFYSLYGDPSGPCIHEIDSNGNNIKNIFKTDDIKLRTFMARFNIGGVCNINNNELLFIYPSEYKIYKYNRDLELEKIYKPKKYSRYFPEVAKFPNDLSPFEYSQAHKKWWGGFLHPISIFYLKNDFILVLLHEIDEFGEYENYLNIHDLSGKTYAIGLRVPFNGFIKYVKNEYIYIDENVEANNSFDYKLKLHVFKLNTSFLKKY